MHGYQPISAYDSVHWYASVHRHWLFMCTSGQIFQIGTVRYA